MMPLHYVRCCMPTRHASPNHALQLAAPNLQQVAECFWGGWRHDTTATCVRLRVGPTTRNGSDSALFLHCQMSSHLRNVEKYMDAMNIINIALLIMFSICIIQQIHTCFHRERQYRRDVLPEMR